MDDTERGQPITDTEARTAFAPLNRFSRIVLAVSGGPDSVALMGLAATAGLRPDIHVVTVNHGLRRQAQAECALVARLAAHFGLRWAQRDWTGEKPGTGIQKAARAARYGLLADYASSVRADCLATAHHRDDQAETVFMRLASGSGIAGLAGMAMETEAVAGLPLLRPFLGFTKARLAATCEARGWPFAEDPSNSDTAYARTRTRALLPVLAAEGLTANRLCKLAERAARADSALSAVVAQVWLDAGGPALVAGHRLPAEWLFQQPAEIGLRLLDMAITATVKAHGLPPVDERLEALERLYGELQAAFVQQRPLARTLRGVLIRLSEAGNIRVSPAPPRSVKADPAN